MNEENVINKKKHGKITTKSIAITGITAAVYMVATLAIAPVGFGTIQFRFSEIMVLLAFIDPGYAPGLILGCAIANCFSPLGIVDVIVGTLGTACTMFAITRTKKLFVATLWPTLFCFFVAAEFYFVEGLPFLFSLLTIMFGEFVVVTCVGYPLFKYLLKNEKLIELLKLNFRK